MEGRRNAPGAGVSIGVIVLAAGEARRMGKPKLLKPLAGRPMLQHTIDLAATADSDEVVVVLGSDFARHRDAVTLPPHGRVVRNEGYAHGQASSLIAGVGALTTPRWAVVLLGDQPEISPRALREVVRATEATDKPVIRTRYDDGPGHPVALARELWPEVTSLSGDEGARSLLAGLPTEWVTLDGPQPPDIDTPEAYGRAVARFGRPR